jgi:hypothetical protein
MDWSLLYRLISDAAKIPLVAAGVGGLIGATIGSICSHHFTQKREREKLLREKAEALINTLGQIEHNLFVWHETLMREASSPRAPQQGDIGNRSMAPIHNLGILWPPAPREYAALKHSIGLEHQRVATLQLLYFPEVQTYYDAHREALGQVVTWLERQVAIQEVDSSSLPETNYAAHGEQWHQASDASETAHAEFIEAVARTIRPYHKPSRALALLRRRR